jgi:hypothetical protein
MSVLTHTHVFLCVFYPVLFLLEIALDKLAMEQDTLQILLYPPVSIVPLTP